MKYIILFTLMACSSLVHANIRPADGLWATSDDPAVGSGLMLTTQNDITLVSIFTYDQDGNNAWYIASGQVGDEGVFEAELRQTQNGSNIIEDNPEAAEFTETVRSLRLEFSGTQLAVFSIDDSEAKTIKPTYFGTQVYYGFPALTGQWLVGDVESEESFILDLTLSEESTSYNDSYISNHPSTDGWLMNCFLVTTGFTQPECKLSADSVFTDSDLYVEVRNIGSKRMDLSSLENDAVYQSFRLNKDRRLLPNDGHWRSFDDPEVGSGLVLRTQGDVTVALLYSYDETGVPTWQIASGVFDENGYFVADLLTPSAGTAIENETQEAATFGAQIQSLEIQMQGLELATFSIDGSTPKTIQNVNFGVELFSTDHVKVNEQSFVYPDQKGAWVLVDEDYSDSRVSILDPFDLNGYQTPPDPRLYEARQYQDIGNDEDFNLTFFCYKNLSSGGYVFELRPYCFGYHFIRPVSGLLKMYYQDIGVNKFRYYITEDYVGDDASGINRDSEVFYLFRLSVD